MTPNPFEPNDQGPDSGGREAEGNPASSRGGSTNQGSLEKRSRSNSQRRFRSRRRPNPTQGERISDLSNDLNQASESTKEKLRSIEDTSLHDEKQRLGESSQQIGAQNETREQAQEKSLRQQSSRHRQNRPRSPVNNERNQTGTVSDEDRSTDNQILARGKRQQERDGQHSPVNRQGGEPRSNQPSRNRGRKPVENRARKNNGQGNMRAGNRTGDHKSGQPGVDAGKQPISSTEPPDAKPVFIGPEFRRIEYPESRSRGNNPQLNSSDPGNITTHQRRRRRGNSGRKNELNGQPPRSEPTPSSGSAGQSSSTGNESSSLESVREVKKTQPSERSQDRGGAHSKQQNKQSSRGRRQGSSKNQSTYVSFSDRYNFDRPAPSIPIPTDRGIKLRSQRGGTSRNWWARRWIEAMERLVDPARLQRGRSYARSGQVLSIQETKTGIEAMVQGSRPQPYKVAIQVTPLTSNQWDQVVDALSEQALFTAQLLAGEMPGSIESVFETAGVSLFPTRTGDLNTSCSCPDWANPCKHVAASHYILGDRFDDDPFLLFRMRGHSQDQIMDALRERRGGQALETDILEEEIPPAPGLEEQMKHFWEPAEALDSFPLTINPPTADMPMLKRLGEPAFLPGESLQSLLKPVYDSFTRSALRAAYSDDEPVESNPSEENGG